MHSMQFDLAPLAHHMHCK